MSALTSIQPPKTPYERMSSRLRELTDAELELMAQQPQVIEFQEQLESFTPRYEHLRESRDHQPAEFMKVEQVWQRLWWEPVDPASLLELHFIKATAKLREDGERLLDQLKQVITKRERLLQTWHEYIDEVLFKKHLLSLLDERMEEFETAQVRAATMQAELPQEPIKEEAVPPPVPMPAALPPAPMPPALPPAGGISLAPGAMGQDCQQTLEMPAVPEAVKSEREKRKYTRYNLGKLVRFGTDQHAFYTGFSENISSGGLFIATFDMRPAISSHLMVSLSLPNQPPMELLCEVAWFREFSESSPELPPGFGCKLLDLTPQQQYMIDEFITSQGSMFMP